MPLLGFCLTWSVSRWNARSTTTVDPHPLKIVWTTETTAGGTHLKECWARRTKTSLHTPLCKKPTDLTKSRTEGCNHCMRSAAPKTCHTSSAKRKPFWRVPESLLHKRMKMPGGIAA